MDASCSSVGEELLVKRQGDSWTAGSQLWEQAVEVAASVAQAQTILAKRDAWNDNRIDEVKLCSRSFLSWFREAKRAGHEFGFVIDNVHSENPGRLNAWVGDLDPPGPQLRDGRQRVDLLGHGRVREHKAGVGQLRQVEQAKRRICREDLTRRLVQARPCREHLDARCALSRYDSSVAFGAWRNGPDITWIGHAAPTTMKPRSATVSPMTTVTVVHPTKLYAWPLV